MMHFKQTSNVVHAKNKHAGFLIIGGIIDWEGLTKNNKF
jgi:hypothetical protein